MKLGKLDFDSCIYTTKTKNLAGPGLAVGRNSHLPVADHSYLARGHKLAGQDRSHCTLCHTHVVVHAIVPQTTPLAYCAESVPAWRHS